MKNKTWVLIMVCIMLLGLMPTPILADEAEPSPYAATLEDVRWVGLVDVTVSLDEHDGYASPFYTITARTDKIDRASISTTLQRNVGGKWETVKNWSQDVSLKSTVTFYYEDYQTPAEKYSYRFQYSIKAYKSSTLIDTLTGTSPTRVI